MPVAVPVGEEKKKRGKREKIGTIFLEIVICNLH
jgi:hypothetical protein